MLVFSPCTHRGELSHAMGEGWSEQRSVSRRERFWVERDSEVIPVPGTSWEKHVGGSWMIRLRLSHSASEKRWRAGSRRG